MIGLGIKGRIIGVEGGGKRRIKRGGVRVIKGNCGNWLIDNINLGC